MLEGKEVDVKLGDYGSAYVDVTSDLKVKVGLEAELDLIKEIKKLAAKTKTDIDDNAIAWIESMLRKDQPA